LNICINDEGGFDDDFLLLIVEQIIDLFIPHYTIDDYFINKLVPLSLFSLFIHIDIMTDTKLIGLRGTIYIMRQYSLQFIMIGLV
jgi:hypothetical protein